MAIRDPLVAIRKKCLECSGGDKNEVATCELVECPLHPFRMGVSSRKSAIPPVAPPPRKDKGPDAATSGQTSDGQASLSQDKSKDSKNGKVSATDQYTLF